MTINKADFKSQIINYFDVFQIQHINDGYQNALIFPDGVKNSFSCCQQTIKKEVILFSKVA